MACFNPASAGTMLGKFMSDEHAEGEFGPPLYLNDGTPFDQHNILVSIPPCKSKTLYEVVNNACTKFAAKPCVGTRNLVKVHQIEEEGKKFEKLEYENTYNYMTYKEYGLRVENFASGMIGQTEIAAQDRVVIYAETQRDWMVAANAAFSMGCQVVTIYATLGEEGALFGITQTKAPVVVADGKLMKILAKIVEKCPDLKHVITLGEVDASLTEKVRKADKTVSSMDELIEKGSAKPIAPRPPAPDDIAVVMYTSGTTGDPKGVLLTHRNITAGVAGFRHSGAAYGIDDTTTFLAYLPLAHIMEMIAEVSMFAFGGQLAYGSPHTLTDTGVKLKRPESMGDALVAQPTFMVFAPAVFDKVYKAVLKKVDNAGGFKKTMFDKALEWGMQNYEAGGVGVNALVNKVVFGPVQGLLGGRLKVAMTGSAPLAPEIQKFMQTVLKCPVRQGYGLTENCACASIGTPLDNSVGTVGPPQPCTVIRLADWPEGNYMNSDKQNPNIGMARGEVLVGGDCIALGYYVDPEDPNPDIVQKNEDEFVKIKGVRYFRTGDVGQITENGTLMIIDRKKDLWKGPQGEYVSLSKVEAALKLSPYVDVPMCYGKTGGDFPIALLCVMESEIRKFAESKSLTGSPAELCALDAVVAEVAKSCKEKCKEMGLTAFEVPTKYVLLPSVDGAAAWTPENEMLTNTMKLKRPAIVRAFAEQIDKAYS